MSKPTLDAFFFGRALAEVMSEKLEDAVSEALSELGKFDAEQRERLREFTETVKSKAEQKRQQGVPSSNASTTADGLTPLDLQATIDELRAETARLRAELQLYRDQTA